jgi:zinc D-Ala-D-Ala carboxypeptidase
MGNLTPNFDREEYACKCGCGKDDIKDELAAKVQLVRNIVKRGIRINSGIRCEKHNAAINATPSSSHIDGWAADLGYHGSAERYQILNAALQVFDRVGIAKTFIHVDVDINKSPGVIWLYS